MPFRKGAVHNKGELHGMSELTEKKVKSARRLYSSGKDLHFLADLMGVHKETIYKAIRGETWKHVPGAVPIRPNRKCSLSDDQVAQARLLYKDGHTFQAIAELLQANHETVRLAVLGKTYQRLAGAVRQGSVPKPQRGSFNGQSKIDEDDVEEMRRLHLKGATFPAIGKIFGISRELVSQAVKGKVSWRHVPGALTSCLISGNRGSGNAAAKLDEPKVADIRGLLLLKHGRARLALEYGVSLSAITDIARDRTWKHVLAATDPPDLPIFPSRSRTDRRRLRLRDPRLTPKIREVIQSRRKKSTA